MITLDGSHGEGGGQILRTALALSTLTGKPFEIKDIRKGRCDSGLKNQHLYCIKTLKQLCNAEVDGEKTGSEYLKYTPGKTNFRDLTIDVETAGSITLLLQSLIIPCIFADKPIKLEIIGGTDVRWSQPIDYFINVLLPRIKDFAEIKCNIKKRGYYPKGNGIVEIFFKPKFNDFNSLNKKIKPFDLIQRGRLLEIKGISHASSNLKKANVAERQAESAKNLLKSFDVPVNIKTEYCDTLSDGSGICLWAVFENGHFLGADSLGERGKKSEFVGKESAENLLKEIKSNSPIDKHLCDQLIPFLALIGGRIRTSEITNHALSNIYVTEKFLNVKFKIDENENIVECEKTL